jgi:hypothetical protein
MKIRADYDPKFYFRFKLIGLFTIGFALWFLYDGLVTYPKQREHALAYAKHYDGDGTKEDWDKIALEHGWPTEYPGEPKTEEDISEQFIWSGASGTVGALMFLMIWRSRGRWIEADGDGITSSWGQSLAFDQVESLEKRQWRSKGIAKVRYRDGGRRKTFVIDDYKFLRQPTDEILCHLESKIDVDKITGGPSEAVAEEIEAAKAQAVADATSTS